MTEAKTEIIRADAAGRTGCGTETGTAVSQAITTDAFPIDNASASLLVENHVPSRIEAQDATLFSFDAETEEFVSHYFGWTTLASEPPIDPARIKAFSDEVRAEGLEHVVLIGEGGSTQASMTLTKLFCADHPGIDFHTADSTSPVFINKLLAECDPVTTLFIISSKSGSTLEPMSIFKVIWAHVAEVYGQKKAGRRFVAITDPDSSLQALAVELNFRAVFQGTPEVGGRFSALSVFGLLPAALVGIDIVSMIDRCRSFQHRCASDTTANPAVVLASFLFENLSSGRPMFSMVFPQPGRVFGLWVEQLVAESLGKHGHGILPNIEIDTRMLAIPRPDRCAITMDICRDASFERDMAMIDPSIPVAHCHAEDIDDIACSFIMWEYAVAMVGVLMGVNPFDQPDVQSTKTAVKAILSGGGPSGITQGCHQITGEAGFIREAELTPAVTSDCPATVDEALEALFSSLAPGDYFALLAFLPFTGEERRIPLEAMRHCAVTHLNVPGCLEIGPRYLHSVGQLHKGGPDNGVFLVLSCDEPDDIPIPDATFTLGELEHAQACGDLAALATATRRAMRIRLADNSGQTLARIAAIVCAAACRAASHRGQ